MKATFKQKQHLTKFYIFIFRADELNRRKSREIPSTPKKMSTLKPTPRLSPALTSPPKRSCLKTETKVGEVANHPTTSTTNQRLIDDTDDPSHLLNVWLGELDSLQKVRKMTTWEAPWAQSYKTFRPLFRHLAQSI
jgi:hypothetical protein